MQLIRPLLLLIAAIGTVLFGSVLATSLVNPGYVEEIAKDIIRHRVETKVNEKVDALDPKFLTGRAEILLRRQQQEVENAKRQLKEKVPERVAAVIAEMRNLDCECRRKIEKNLRDGLDWQIAVASEAQERLNGLIRTQYMEVAEKLTREFRIFTATNALVFALLGMAAWLRRGAGVHLVAPAVVLVAAAGITAFLYLFKQDWMHTILFSDYVGFTYLAYLSIVFAFLCDILFNCARITTRLLNAVFQGLQMSLQVSPC